MKNRMRMSAAYGLLLALLVIAVVVNFTEFWGRPISCLSFFEKFSHGMAMAVVVGVFFSPFVAFVVHRQERNARLNRQAADYRRWRRGL